MGQQQPKAQIDSRLRQETHHSIQTTSQTRGGGMKKKPMVAVVADDDGGGSRRTTRRRSRGLLPVDASLLLALLLGALSRYVYLTLERTDRLNKCGVDSHKPCRCPITPATASGGAWSKPGILRRRPFQRRSWSSEEEGRGPGSSTSSSSQGSSLHGGSILAASPRPRRAGAKRCRPSVVRWVWGGRDPNCFLPCAYTII